MLAEYSFDAWGNHRNPQDWSPITNNGQPLTAASADRGFTGHEMLDNVELVHMNGRIYDPALGRFLSPDPLVQAPGNLQSYNRYAYVWNNRCATPTRPDSACSRRCRARGTAAA